MATSDVNLVLNYAQWLAARNRATTKQEYDRCDRQVKAYEAEFSRVAEYYRDDYPRAEANNGICECKCGCTRDLSGADGFTGHHCVSTMNGTATVCDNCIECGPCDCCR